MLHVAPEKCLESAFKKQLKSGYLSADLFDSRAMEKMDITNIHYGDKEFDVIYCNHVLEHVEDDRKAIKEFHRVLKDTGWAILMVPISAEKTYEDPSITEPAERKKHFGQEDHVRKYGPDYVDRLREGGFNVEETSINELAQGQEIIKMGLTKASGHIYYCTR